jgi:tetratricopeptide (TPR) repeat protein
LSKLYGERKVHASILRRDPIFFISIVGHSQSTPQEFIDKAYELSSAGKIGEAVSLYNIAIAKFPDEPIFYTLKGGLMVQHIDYFATDDSLYNSALNLFDKALELDSGFVPAHNNRALLNLYFQHYDLAVFDFTQVIKFSETDDDRHSAMQDRATAKGYNKDYKGAIQDYDFLIKAHPNDADLYLNQGVMYSSCKQLDSAMSLYKKGLAINPQHQALLNNMGMLMIRLQDYNAAIGYFKKAIELNPDEPFAYNNTGFALIKLNKPKEALEYIDHSLTLYPQNSYAYKNRAIALIAIGNKNEACTDLANAVKLGYSKTYDDEVDKLMAMYCEK